MFKRRRFVQLDDDAPVATSRQVLDEGLRIKLVVHFYSEAWQFTSGMEDGEADIRVVHYHDLLALDPTLGSLRKISAGTIALRHPEGEWEFEKFYSDKDYDNLMDSLE